MKKRMKKGMSIAVFLLLIVTVTVLLFGCGDAESEKIPLKGEDGQDGRDGLSVYELYCKNYIYIKSEKEWLDEYMAGTLEKIDNSVLEEKNYYNGTSEDISSEIDSIHLCIDKYFYDKTFTVEDFHMIEVKEVECIWTDSKEGEPGNQIYTITLKNGGPRNIIRAIRKLEIYAFTVWAEPNEPVYIV